MNLSFFFMENNFHLRSPSNSLWPHLASMPNMGCPKEMKNTPNMALVFRQENEVYRKNELYYEKDLFMPFSKHPLLLFLGFVKHDWQLACLRWFVLIVFLENLNTNQLKHASCQSCLPKPRNKIRGCFVNGMNRPFS
jgi:hypothetical protein